MLEDGQTQKRVAQRVGASPSVISRLWRLYQKTNSYGGRQSQGRHCCTTAREDCYIVTTALQDRLTIARSLQNDLQYSTETRVSTKTIRNRLHEGRFRAKWPARGDILTALHRAARLEFARQHLDWELRQ
ncbi:uncharacterized protein LOC143250633 [Tachypleus tridentatus]|uniref:uncharacterized protein LOC143250633 n=1 Tax=Tachypleus tridentatus TaxID=6853 RepID=UPI003FD52D2C